MQLFPHLPRPLIVAHRGASGLLPEQTLPTFELAIRQGADAIELDIVPTRDGVLIARHEPELSLTTTIAADRTFAQYCTRKFIDGYPVDGWFSTDLLLEQIQRLGATQRFPFRDRSHDACYPVPTLDEVLDLADSHRTPVFLEIKHPAHFASLGFPVDDLLLATLRRHGTSRIVLQSFDAGFLKRLRHRTSLPIIQLFEAPDFDLDDIATYAQGIGPWKRLIVPAPLDVDGAAHAHHPRLLPPTPLISDAHARGLFIATWTFRDEPEFLAPDYAADPAREIRHFISLGVDSLTTDFPSTALAVRTANR